MAHLSLTRPSLFPRRMNFFHSVHPLLCITQMFPFVSIMSELVGPAGWLNKWRSPPASVRTCFSWNSQWKERTHSRNVSSDLHAHVCTCIHTRTHSHAHTHTHNVLGNIKPISFQLWQTEKHDCRMLAVAKY